MPAVRVDILCECEGCQKRFGVEVDLATELSEYMDFEELVRDTINGSNTTNYTWGVRGLKTVERYPLSYQPTIQADLLLCDICSKKCDDEPIVGNLTLQQVQKALGLPERET